VEQKVVIIFTCCPLLIRNLATERWGVAAKRTAQWMEIQETTIKSVVVGEAFYLQHTNILHPSYMMSNSSSWDSSCCHLDSITSTFIMNIGLVWVVIIFVAASEFSWVSCAEIFSVSCAEIFSVPWSDLLSFTRRGRVEVDFFQSHEVTFCHSRVEVE